MDSNTHLQKVKHFHDYDAGQYKRHRYHSDSCEGLAYVTRKELVLTWVNVNSGRILDIGCGYGDPMNGINKSLQYRPFN